MGDDKADGRDSSASLPSAGASSVAVPSGGNLAIVPFKRRFLGPTIVLGFAELIGIFYPLWVVFDLRQLGWDTLVRTG
ncbi:MAG: hypothetical protein NT062_24135, partial [Proteobacteria bacterium]|nr:hypothetical protein [Pseudomonadota bacterium]